MSGIQQISFSGLEAEPDVSMKAVDKANKKRRRESQKESQKKYQQNKRNHNKQNEQHHDHDRNRNNSNNHKNKNNNKMSAKRQKIEEEVKETMQKYSRGDAPKKSVLKEGANKRLKAQLTTTEKLFHSATESAARAEILLPSTAGFLQADGMDHTWRFTQETLKENVEERTAQKIFDLTLDQFGPYNIDYTRNGRHILLGGRKGHIALMEWESFKLTTELNVNETIRDVKFLHNEQMYAVAQKKYVYIYDQSGTELHCLRHHLDTTRLDFLPYHFLLTTVGKTGILRYHDTSTGAIVCEHKSKLGACDVMKSNPKNAIIHLGHSNGSMTLWTPNMSSAIVKMLCHRGPVLSIGIDITGNTMVTSGLDGQVHIWDIRTYKNLHSILL